MATVITRPTTKRQTASQQSTKRRSDENMRYVDRLLRDKQPGFAARLEMALMLVEQELRTPGMPSDGKASDGS